MEKEKLLLVVKILSLIVSCTVCYAEQETQDISLEQFHSLATELHLIIDGLPQNGNGCKDCGGEVRNVQNATREFTDGVLVFISFSMPKSSLIELNANAEKYNAKLIMRGIYNNSFKEMKDKILSIHHNGLKIDIDPQLFKQFSIRKIPTFVLVSKGREIARLEGNVSLDFAYEKLIGDK